MSPFEFSLNLLLVEEYHLRLEQIDSLLHCIAAYRSSEDRNLREPNPKNLDSRNEMFQLLELRLEIFLGFEEPYLRVRMSE